MIVSDKGLYNITKGNNASLSDNGLYNIRKVNKSPTKVSIK